MTQNSRKKQKKIVFIFSILSIMVLSWKRKYHLIGSKIEEEKMNTSVINHKWNSCLTFKHSTDTGSQNELKPQTNVSSSRSKYEQRTLNPDIYSRIQISNVEECKSKRLLVYTCGETKCGGFGDRVKGIVSTFLLALLTNRSLVFDVGTPCEMSNFLRPRNYNWEICLPYIRSLPKFERLDLDFGIGDYKIFLKKDFDFQSSWNKTIINVFVDSFILRQMRWHRQFKQQLQWMALKSNAEVIHEVFNTLFQPSLEIEHELSYLQSNLNGKKLICAHVRTGRAASEPGVNNKKASKINPMLNFLYRFDHHKSVIFIATDYDEIRQSTKEMFSNVVSSKCEILHIDMKSKTSQDAQCRGMYNTLLEWFTLTTCDILVIPHSGYSCTALYPRASTENIFVYYLQKNMINHRQLEDLDGFCRVF